MSLSFGAARSNYVEVKDLAAFTAWVERTGGVEIIRDDSMVGLAATTESGAFPTSTMDEDLADYVEMDFGEEFAKHLVDGQVLVLLMSGSDRDRYSGENHVRSIFGRAEAYTSDGRKVELSIKDIYLLAATKFNVPSDLITRAEN